MYTAKTRKWYIVASLILATVLCFLGVFMIFRPKRITASAVESTDSNLYFEAGAAIELSNLEAQLMRFQLNVTESAFPDEEHYALRIMINDEAVNAGVTFSEKNCKVDPDDTSDKLVNYSTLFADYGIVILPSDLSFEDKVGLRRQLQLVVNTNTTQDVILQAEIIDLRDYAVASSAYSDTRNWGWIYEKATEAGEVVSNTWAGEIVDFSNSVDKTDFVLYDGGWIDSTNGLSLLVNVPQEYLDKIAQGEILVEETWGQRYGVDAVSYRKYEQYFLTLEAPQSGDILQPGDDYIYDTYRPSGQATYNASQVLSIMDGTIGVFQVPFACWDDIVNTNYQFTILKVTTEQDFHVGGIAETVTKKVVDTTNNITVNPKSIAQEILATDVSLTEEEMAWLQDFAGVTPSTDMVTVIVKYKRLSNANDPTSVQEDVLSFEMKAVQAYSKAFAIASMYNLVKDSNNNPITNIADFNVVYSGKYYQDQYEYGTGERIVLQANDLEYTYSSSTQTGTITVVYNDFQYKDVAIRIQSNDPAQIGLTAMCYTKEVTVNSTSTTIKFDLVKIASELKNAYNWIVDANINVTISGKPDGVECVYKKGYSLCLITFPNDKESELVTLSLTAIAEIVPDIDYSCTYKYVALGVDENGELTETTITSEPFIATYSKTLDYHNSFNNFMVDFGEIVEDALVCNAIEGEYYIPASAKVGYSTTPLYTPEGTTPTCTITVQYNYNTLFKITNNVTADVKYKALNDTNLKYYGDYFANPIPSGYRVDYIESESSQLRITEGENKEDHTQTLVEVLCSANAHKILPVHVVYTDKWLAVINWMSPYKNTPFAVKTATETEIRVADYPDIQAITKEDVAKILGRENLVIGGMVDANAPTVTFDNVATYTIDITYGEASLKQIDYDGHANEIQVPLTSYVDWCKSFGENWTILYLNTQDTKYFQYSNEVNREDLYGFFAVAVFEEQVSDLNYWFRNNTGDGQMTIFSSRAVEGSSLYKFFDNMTTKGIVSKAIGTLGMMLCETIDDSNKIYQSYYFYLDGNSDNAYISNGGADNAFDEDSALENKGEDIVDDVKDGWDKFTDKGKSLWQRFRESRWDTVVFIALGVIAGVVVLGISIKYGKRFYIWVTSEPKKKTAKKRKKAGKKK